MRLRVICWLAVLALAAGCGGSKRAKTATIPIDTEGGLSVVLLWTAPVDLDLYLTDPLGHTAYFGNPWTRSGAQLRADASCDDLGSGETNFKEIAGTRAPLAGRYRITVDFVDRCGIDAAAVPFRLWARLGGSVEELTAAVQFRRRNSNVLELEVTPDLAGLRRLATSEDVATVFPAARKVTVSY
ncbi:MAG TPA: hypothetical protein VEB21_20640 [Terriglobales bacterium]|nr:hypothetical protein [Terriglobales bacterium]